VGTQAVPAQLEAYQSTRGRVHNSLITRLFEGLLLNSLTCACGASSLNVEVFD
jgi:hypothetical protein